ncbi:MAG: methylated-DNA--[protein]-cysteine S-methyltransferase [Acidimicrobiia bacterium]|nr:methylated-DNA--[protein]-cysteine S-methyltransferase [Acidimicrobiia bacterium]
MTKTERGAVQYSSPFGPGWVVFEGGAVVEVQLPGGSGPPAGTADPPATVLALAAELTRYFNGHGWVDHPELAVRAGTTPFTRAVYAIVSAIPEGSVRTYGEIARQLDRPGAARAVGRAMATNRFPVAIPCHRVVGSDGSLTGFAGGIGMKQALLRMESSHG